jgi:hypothetical protein
MSPTVFGLCGNIRSSCHNLPRSIHSNAGYLNEENARSGQEGHHFMSEDVPKTTAPCTLKHQSSKQSCLLQPKPNLEHCINMHARGIVEEMGYKQPPTPLQIGNLMADSIINSRVQPKQTESMDMKFYWLCKWGINQEQFRFYWHPWALQRGDYWTKHHAPANHCNMLHEISTPYKVVMDLGEKVAKMKIAPK